MVFSPDFEEIGYIEKTHGIAGWLRVNLHKNSILDLSGMEFLFLEQHGQKVPFRIKEVAKNASLILFHEFNKPEKAQPFTGSGLFVIATDSKSPAVQSLIGYVVKDQNQDVLGKIISYTAIPNNPLIGVEIDGKEVSLPLTEDLVLSTNHKSKVITYQVPQGLLDL